MLDFLRQSDILAGGDFQQIAIEGDGKGASLGGKAEEKNAAGRIGQDVYKRQPVLLWACAQIGCWRAMTK